MSQDSPGLPASQSASHSDGGSDHAPSESVGSPEPVNAPEPADAPEPGSIPLGLDPATPAGRRRIALAFVTLIATALALGLLAGTCWGGSPEAPLEELGLVSGESRPEPGEGSSGETEPPGDIDSDPPETVELDPEQQAFAERRAQELSARQSETEPGSAVPDFTDHALVQELAGAWRLDLGRGRRGYRVRFGTDSVRKVHRQRFDVTLFDVVGLDGVGRGLPPYFTVLDLPDGKLLAFLDAAGTFQLVLEDVRRESDGRFSWRGPLRERRYGKRLDGESPWRFGRERGREKDRGRSREQDEESQRSAQISETESPTENPGVGVRQPSEPVPGAVRDGLYEELERHLDEFAFGLMERDPDRVFALWGGRPDGTTREVVAELLERYVSMRVWTRLLTLDMESTPDGPQARFEVVVTVQGAPKGARNRRDVDLRDVRWRGRVALGEGGIGVQLDPFQG